MASGSFIEVLCIPNRIHKVSTCNLDVAQTICGTVSSWVWAVGCCILGFMGLKPFSRFCAIPLRLSSSQHVVTLSVPFYKNGGPKVPREGRRRFTWMYMNVWPDRLVNKELEINAQRVCDIMLYSEWNDTFRSSHSDIFNSFYPKMMYFAYYPFKSAINMELNLNNLQINVLWL